MSQSRKNILHLFERPTEPVYMPKGIKKTAFKIPGNCTMKPFVRDFVLPYFANDTEHWLPVKKIDNPDISVPIQLGRNDSFSLFVPKHREMAGNLIQTFMGAKTCDELQSMGVYCRNSLNPQLFNYALTVAILNHHDCKRVTPPPLYSTRPQNFIDSATLSRAMRQANLVPADLREPIEMPLSFSASSNVEEHRVAYWREDIGINLHHWHWHVVYPQDGTDEVVIKDRRGELFYFMHQQMLARYDLERLSNGMSRVESYANWDEPIPDGYFPKLASQVPGRHDGAVLRDIHRKTGEYFFTIEDMKKWRDRIYEGIHDGFMVKANGEKLKLTERDGIDILGNMVEASKVLSPDPDYYGNLHNSGHVLIAGCHDPDNRHLEPLGIMGDTSTAMRDPFFYRWHAAMNDIFMEHKNTLPEYPVEELDFPGVRVTGIEVVTSDLPTSDQPTTNNYLDTFWQQNLIDISRGLNYARPGPVLLRFTHLNHSEFIYRIKAINYNNYAKKGTVRIFMAPKLDESGKQCTFYEQKNLMIQTDKFTVTLNPGVNLIERRSTESSLTIPSERTFPKIDKDVLDDNDSEEQQRFCECGWPQHMLLPKGTKEGFPMELFVMVSDYSGDEVKQDSPGAGCGDAAIFCGIRDKKYPDARSMGYPFDRRPRDGVDTLAEFLTGNMTTCDVTIHHYDEKPNAARETSSSNRKRHRFEKVMGNLLKNFDRWRG